VRYLSRFTLTVIGLDIPGVKNKEPDQSFCPKIYPDPGLNNSQQVKLMANQKPWPTLVIEIGVSESVASIRQLYLNHLTGVNVYIGVAYNKNKDRTKDTWYCCIAQRDINPPNPHPVNPGPDWPPFIGIHESADEPPYDKLSTPAPAAWTFHIDTDLLWHPQPAPPGLPQQFTVNCEDIRLAIVSATS
jgi:hypothetical protein